MDDIKACANPYQGPTKTAQSTLTKCCIGAALIGPSGMTMILLKMTLIAINSAVMVNFLIFNALSPYPIYLSW